MKNYPKTLLAATFIFMLTSIYANAQSVIWSQTYGSTMSDGGESMVITQNREIVIAGFKSANNLKDVLLMKTDEVGNELWSKTYNLGINDLARSLRQTTDGGFIIAGMTEVNPQTHDPFLIKTDSAGNVQWQHNYDYIGVDDRAHAVWQTSDGGYILVGQTLLVHGSFSNNDMYVVKTDMNGIVQWTKIFYWNEVGGDVALGVQQLSDKGYIIGGFSHNPWASYIIRTDSLGNEIWSNVYEGKWQSECYDIQPTIDGGFIFTGLESSFTTDTDLLITKLDANGNLLWKKIYGSEDGEKGQFFQQLPDGGLLIAGMSSHGTGSWDMYVMRTNSNGDSLWARTIGGLGDDRALSVVTADAGNYYVAGSTYSYGQGAGDVYLVKLIEILSGITQIKQIPGSFTLDQNNPNPFNPETKISYSIPSEQLVKLHIYDLTGKELMTLVNEVKPAGRYEIKFNASLLSSGIYFYRIKAGGYSNVRRMMFVK